MHHRRTLNSRTLGSWKFVRIISNDKCETDLFLLTLVCYLLLLNFQSLKRYCSKRISYCINLNAPRKLSFTNFSLVFRWNDVRWVFNGTETITLQGPKIKQKKSKNFFKNMMTCNYCTACTKVKQKKSKNVFRHTMTCNYCTACIGCILYMIYNRSKTYLCTS